MSLWSAAFAWSMTKTCLSVGTPAVSVLADKWHILLQIREEYKIVWRTLWQWVVALRCQHTLLRHCMCWHSGEVFHTQRFPFSHLTIPEKTSQHRALRQRCHTAMGRPSEVQGFLHEEGHFPGVCPSPQVQNYSWGRSYKPRSRLLLSGGAGQQQVSGWGLWYPWVFCTVGMEACKAMLEAILPCGLKNMNNSKI